MTAATPPPNSKPSNIGAICGGVVSEIQQKKDEAKYGVWANAMSYVMPDKEFAEYKKLKDAGDDREAAKLFDKHARSQV